MQKPKMESSNISFHRTDPISDSISPISVFRQVTGQDRVSGRIEKQYPRVSRGRRSDALFWELCYSHYLYPAFLTAWSSGIFDRDSRRPVVLEDVAKCSGFSADGLLALLPTLILFRAVRQTRNGSIVATPRSQPEYSVWEPMFRRHVKNDEHIRRFIHLFHQSGQESSKKFWSAQLGSQGEQNLLLGSIDAHSQGTARGIADELCRVGTKNLIDVGSGLGTNTFAALKRSRRLNATLIDLPKVIHEIAEMPELKQYESRTSTISMDALKNPWPQSDGVYLLAHFLQDFGRVDRSRLLRQAWAAMQPGAELWIHGHFWRGQSASVTVAAFSYYLYCRLGGGVLSVEQQTRECREAGFRFIRSVQTSTTQNLLVFLKRG